MSDVAILRRAASLLRDRATAATPGPWEHVIDRGSLHHRDRSRLKGIERFREYRNDVDLGADHDTAAYIALVHPPVALALADWLDDEAARGLGRPDNLAAYAVARAVLREAGE
jgi:hypothetical protein